MCIYLGYALFGPEQVQRPLYLQIFFGGVFTALCLAPGANRGSRTHLKITLAFNPYRRATCATDTSGAVDCRQIDRFSSSDQSRLVRRTTRNPKVSTIHSGHYLTLYKRGRAVRPDAYDERTHTRSDPRKASRRRAQQHRRRGACGSVNAALNFGRFSRKLAFFSLQYWNSNAICIASSARSFAFSSSSTRSAQDGLRTAHPVSHGVEQSIVYPQQHRRGSAKLATAVLLPGVQVDRVVPSPWGSP